MTEKINNAFSNKLKKNNKDLNFNKPLIFNNDQRGLLLKEYKKKLKSQICENEDNKVLLKLIKECLNNFKKYLSEIGEIQKTNQINTSRNFNDKIVKLIRTDNSYLSNHAKSLEAGIGILQNQLNDFSLKFEDKNQEKNDLNLQEDYVFYLQNLFLSKESQIFYLQCLLNYYKENKTQGILAEYYDLEDNVISNVMDAGLNVLRKEMAKSTRYLNLEERKNKETVEKIEEIAREIKVFKETNSLEKAGKDQMTSANNLLSQNTGTSTPNVSPIENNKNYNNNNSNIKDKAKIKKIKGKK